MCELTRNGITYNLEKSPYTVDIIYDSKTNDYITFLFSSNLYKNKFLNSINENREKINNSLSKRFSTSVKFNKLCDIKLYSAVEKRGFLIKNSKESYSCLNTIRLSGETLTVKNYQE